MQLPAFDIDFNEREDKFQNIVICSKKDIGTTSHTKVCGASYISFVISAFDSNINKFIFANKMANRKRTSNAITNCLMLPVEMLRTDFTK